MEEIATADATHSDRKLKGVARKCPRSLREWLKRVEEAGELHRIGEAVALKEELSAITYLAAREEGAPALLFDRFSDHDGGASVLTNMLGSSVRRFAIALG